MAFCFAGNVSIVGRKTWHSVSKRFALIAIRREHTTSLLQRFHPAFMRENTWEAWEASSRQRLDFNLGTNIAVEKVSQISSQEESSNDSFLVEFSDGHVGHFEPPREAESVWASDLPNWRRELWGTGEHTPADIQRELEFGGSLRFGFDQLSGTSMQQRFAEALHVYGIVLVDGMPVKEDAVIDFANMLPGYVYPTVYGNKFSVKAVSQANNLAFSNLGLQMHTDLPFYAQPPSIQLFHCLKQAEKGGESMFLDGFDAAMELNRKVPEAFRKLCDVKVRFQDLTDSWHLSARHPLFKLEESAEGCSEEAPRLQRVCFNERARDSWRAWSRETPEDQLSFYNALSAYETLVEQPERYIRLLVQPGEMICVDNWRVMHSRSGFQGSRHLEGAYIDWDALYGRWRGTKTVAGLTTSTTKFPTKQS
mmetsp:Transcript_10849/g.17900  ORF Transcript_10849/g.17900 Transcript_10849/m.17900 type:complete len:422 (-) Transcript_10849:80-1345(-)